MPYPWLLTGALSVSLILAQQVFHEVLLLWIPQKVYRLVGWRGSVLLIYDHAVHRRMMAEIGVHLDLFDSRSAS